MTVKDVNSVDMVGICGTTGKAVLTITDHLPWEDDGQEHLLMLQEKINTYLRFVESGEIFVKYPEAKDRQIVFEVVTKYRQDDQAKEFCSQAALVVANAGFELKISLFGEEAK